MSIKYIYNFSVFYNEDEISYYLLGAFITDGCIYKNGKNTFACQISSCDEDWLQNIKNIIGINLKLHKFKENYWGVRIIRNEIAQWFISHGCFPKKTLTVKMPIIPIKYMPDFLRGCIDGDGSIGTYFNKSTKRTCCLISASKEFLDEVQKYLLSIGIKSGITEKKQKKPSQLNGKLVIQKHKCYNLYTTGQNCFRFLKHIYYDNNQLNLPRKYKLAKEIIYFYENNLITDKRRNKSFNVGCKILWPENEDLLNMINQSNVEQVAKKLGVHGTAIRNRLKRRNLYDKIK